MNNQRRLGFSLFIALLLIGAASAQQRVAAQEISLASMPAGERFVYERGGFSIALPQKPTATDVVNEKDHRGMQFDWEVKEGRITVTSSQFFGGVSFASEKDREKFLKSYLADILKKGAKEGLELIKETPYALGEFNGKTYLMGVHGTALEVDVLLAGDKFFEIAVFIYPDVPNSDTLLFKAADSFSLLPAPVKE